MTKNREEASNRLPSDECSGRGGEKSSSKRSLWLSALLLVVLTRPSAQKRLSVNFTLRKLRVTKMIYLRKLNVHTNTTLKIEIINPFFEDLKNTNLTLTAAVFRHRDFNRLGLFTQRAAVGQNRDIFVTDPNYPPAQDPIKNYFFMVRRRLDCSKIVSGSLKAIPIALNSKNRTIK